MDALFESVNHWHWLIAGVVLLALEIFSGTGYLIWMAISAAIVGLLLGASPELSWQTQLLVFVFSSFVSVGGWRVWAKKRGSREPPSRLNRRAEQYVGRVGTLDEPIVNGEGKIRFDDSWWRVSGKEMDKGTKVQVTAVEGVTLIVERA